MSGRQSSRRDFLKGKSAIEAAEDLLPDDRLAAEARSGRSAGGDSSTAGESLLLEVSRRAMACDFQILLNDRQYEGATEVAMRALDLVESLEDQLTVFRSHSEVCRINQAAAHRAVGVEPRLFRLLRRAFELSESTGGAFDISAGPLSKAWGFFRRQGRFPDQAEIGESLARVGYQAIRLNAENRTIQFDRPGMEINLGAIGKGYALDRCSALLETEGIYDFILHGGKSSILARGERATQMSRGRGWSVALRHPLKPDKPLARLWLRDRAIGTSGDANQFFYHQGRRYGHVIDPRTGFPSQGVLSATVVAASAADADALATALFVMKKEEAVEYCQSRPELGLVLLTPGRRSGETELTVVGLEPADVECDQSCDFVAANG